MMKEVITIANNLSELIRNMQKCLQCTICLHTISNPMRTRCGHRFCRECIQKVLQNKNPTCPLCNSDINRRDTRKDEHIEIYIDRLEKLIEAVRKDSGIDVRLNVSRRHSTRESCSSDSKDSAKQDSEDYNQPSCSYAQPKPFKKSASSQAKRAVPKSKRSGNSRSKKDDAPGSSNITKYFPKHGLSGVEPLPSDETNYSDDSSMKVHSWLETLPRNMELCDPRRSRTPDCNLNDTLSCSSTSQAGEKVVDTVSLESECPGAFREDGRKQTVTLGRSSKDQKDKDNRERMIKAAKSRTASSTSAPRANDAAGGMQTSWVDRRQSASSNEKSDNDRDAVREQAEDRRSDVQRTSPCDLLPSMKKNWTSVVQFGKEMRSRKQKKIRSLNVSIENMNKKSANESAKEPAPRQKKLPGGAVRRSVERPGVADNDANEKLPVHKDAEEEQPGDKNNGSMADMTRPAGRPSLVVLEDEDDEQVYKRNPNNHQTNGIVEVVDEQQRDLELEDRSDDESSEKVFMRQLGLCQTPPRKRIETSSIGVTPVRDPNAPSPDLLENYRPSPEEVKIFVPIVPQPSANFQSSTPLLSRLSLKRRDTDSKLDEPATAAGLNSRLLAVKRDLNREIGRTESIVAEPAKSANTPDEPEGSGRRGNVEDTGSHKSKRQGKSLAMFKKLGKLVRYHRKPVKFLYLGSTRPRSSTLQDRVQRWQRPCTPMEHENTPKLAFESSFGNNTRITVNTAVSPQDGIQVGSEAGREEAAANPKRKRLSESDSDSVKSVAKPLKSNIVIESMGPFSKDIISATGTSQPRDSNDILFVSIYENEGNDVEPFRQGAPTKATALNSSVKMLSSKDDSQLKFLALDSPTRDTQPAAKPEQQGDKDIGAKRSNLSDTRGVHSRALARTSMQGSEGPKIGDTPRKTRKKLTSRNNLVQKMKTEDDDREVGATYTKNPAAYGKDDAMKYCPADKSAQFIEIVSLSSDSDAENRAYAPKEQKKVYKRIVTQDTESSSSSKRSNSFNNQQPGISATIKRKRSISPDSDSYKDLDMIVDSWSKDLQPMNKFSKIGRSHGPATSVNIGERRVSGMSSDSNSSWIVMRTATSQRRRLPSSEVDSNVKEKNTKGRGPSGREFFDDDSPDFGAIIDSNRNIQRAAAAGDREPTRQRSEEVACLMQDNFDEIIANVDTEQLIDDYCRPSKRKCDAGADAALNVYEDGRIKDTSVSRLHKGSDKENEYKESGRLYDSEIDGDKTLTPEHVNAADKSSRIGDDGLRGRAKSVKSTSQQPTTRNAVANRLSTINPAFPGIDRILEETVNDVTLKETCCEQDSLMNITQHQMLLKQFEDDLFGKTTNVQPPMKPQRQQQTPRMQKRNEGVSRLDLKGQDAEHSAEEDDIVENTPNAKTKNMQPIASSVKISARTPVVQINWLDRSLSSATGRNATPLGERSRHPVYQSTPKVQGQANDDCVGAASTTVRQLKFGSANEPMNRRSNEVTGFNGQRERLCFICSGLLPAEIEQVKRLASLTNATYLNQFNLSVTHVIVKVDKKNNSASKTLKYLQGVAHRKWVVSHQWVIDSLKEKKLINEERYEVVDGATFETGPRNSRLRQKELFEGFTFLCIGPYEDISVEQYEELLRATGGTVVCSQEALAVERTQKKIIVIQEQIYEYEIIVGWHKKTGAVPVVHDWILECISQYKLIPISPYLQELLPKDVLALGYPKFLLEEDPDDEDYDSVELLTQSH
ncbi:uncharacterized protein LOC117217654 isoform X1 [Megalopta genalis]|uniref:uncharacterized protein LOC117217654 isoform X1 n=1 Tax=Megalopta genalis TaxID=115081 RepID=UPI003FD57B87